METDYLLSRDTAMRCN